MDLQFLKELVLIDSPSGFTQRAAEYVFKALTDMGWSPRYTNKGAVVCALGETPTLGIAAHLDTLGGIVSQIKSDGTLRISKVGGPLLNAYEGSYCRVYTMDDQVYTGTLLLDNTSVHVNREAAKANRTETNMHIRLDELVDDVESIKALGIQVG
ncbi:MAG: glucanase, partial [Bacteroidota bacterium]